MRQKPEKRSPNSRPEGEANPTRKSKARESVSRNAPFRKKRTRSRRPFRTAFLAWARRESDPNRLRAVQPEGQARSQLSGFSQTRINSNLAAC